MGTGDELLETLQRAIAKVGDLSPDEVQPTTRLEDLGIDSLAVAEVIVELEMQLDCELPVHVLRGLDAATTVADVASELRLSSTPTWERREAPSSGLA